MKCDIAVEQIHTMSASTNGDSSSKVKYSKAASSESEANNNTVSAVEEEGEVDFPDKSRTTCMQKCALYSCFLGFVFILAGLVW